MKPLSDKIKFIPRKVINDDRGWFLKVIDGKEEGLPNKTGEVYLTNAKPGQSKGSHYHHIANEWFTLLTGTCTLLLFDIDTNEEMSIELQSNNPITIFVPHRIAHIFINNGEQDFLLLAYSDELYDPIDTIPYKFNK